MKKLSLWVEGENRSELKFAVLYILFSIGSFFGIGLGYVIWGLK